MDIIVNMIKTFSKAIELIFLRKLTPVIQRIQTLIGKTTCSHERVIKAVIFILVLFNTSVKQLWSQCRH